MGRAVSAAGGGIVHGIASALRTLFGAILAVVLAPVGNRRRPAPPSDTGPPARPKEPAGR